VLFWTFFIFFFGLYGIYWNFRPLFPPKTAKRRGIDFPINPPPRQKLCFSVRYFALRLVTHQIKNRAKSSVFYLVRMTGLAPLAARPDAHPTGVMQFAKNPFVFLQFDRKPLASRQASPPSSPVKYSFHAK
ncbi:MAG: hypothetical protein K2G44_00165, partial [Clostridia bacterium]|nr:hypothetical protein [Clostridia bacterium]